MPSAHLILKEEEVIRLVLEFLSNRELNISQLSLEREAGVINGTFSDDVLFLRQLILDGQWDDVLKFIQPLEGVESFDSGQFRYIVLKHKYIELLCIRSEIGVFQNIDVAVEEVVKCLNELEKYCPTKEDYNNFCLLLTLPRLSDHFDYKNWNPSNARVNCFKAVYPLVEKFLPLDKKGNIAEETATGDRLIQLVIKGILYESCVEFCQQRATSASSDTYEMHFTHVLNGTGFSDSDLSLLSWLQYIPPETFSYPFEQKTLNVDVEQLEKPGLEASWSEQILVTPIKPKIFPHSATPFTRLRTSDVMSRSLTPNLDVVGLGRNIMAFSMSDMSAMSKSFAGFHLTGKKAVNTSVDRLFEGRDVFSASVTDLYTIPEASSKDHSLQFPLGKKTDSSISQEKCTKSEVVSHKADEKQTIQEISDDNSKKLSSLSPPSINKSDSSKSLKSEKNTNCKEPDSTLSSEHKNSGLWKEFQRQKQHLLDQFESQERQRTEFLSEFNASTVSEENHIIGNSPEIMQSRIQKQLEDNFVTPVSLSGQNQHPYKEQLTTSTPKSVGSWNTTPLPQSSPVLPKQDASDTLSTPVSGWTKTPVAKDLRPTMDNPSIATTSPSIKADAQYTPVTVGHASDDQYMGGMLPMSQPIAQHYGTQSYLSPKASETNMPQYNKSLHNPMAQQFVTAKMTPQQSDKPTGSTLYWKKSKFLPINKLEDAQAIRTGDFHPSGQLYAIGSNSKTLRICAYPSLHDLWENHVVHQPTVLLKRMKHHKGSIYCLAWNVSGDLLGTGSNDKTVKLMRFNPDTCNLEGGEAELTMHDGTVRDMCFIEDINNRSSLLISGGAGDCKIYATDCETATPFQALSGHSGHILSLYSWGGAMFVSGSQDKTIRFWDLRTQGCVNLVVAPPASGSGPGSPAAAVCVDPSGRLLVSGHEDANCMLYDIRGGRIIQCFQPHASDIRTIRFSPKAFYLLTGSYDNKIILTDLQGDLTQPLPSVVVAEHSDKVIQGRWHPQEFSFLTTSADKTAILWALPTRE
ncbi:WD repeat-containing protein 47-like [Tachypleus tridentatus]|uniref:WD repeat-containing protein 47-like n=1 Tax=Tachypleus tridentatus TaxID=6853 RepID=UPI003FD50FE1